MSEGLEAFLATCRSALDRMDEYPDFIFTCSSAAHLEFVEQTDPQLFKRIQQRAQEGRWVNVGGWWVEADCNLPSGESFIRQALLGQLFYHSRFGKISIVGYCIDSFGHHANLPQLLKKCGLDHYVFMRPDDTEKELPVALFNWVAPSGDSVSTYRIALHYSNFARSVNQKLIDLLDHPNFTTEHDWMLFYGVGNHGGGPTKEQIEQILKAQENSSNIVFSSPEKFFAAMPKGLEEIWGDMHRHAVGCYSAHSEIKQLNRRAENALMRAEKLCVLAEHHTHFRANWEALKQGWKNVCFNQFHDILGGVSIKEAYDDAIAMYHEAISIADRETRTALQSIASQIDTLGDGEAIIVFNPKCFESEEEFNIELWHPHASEKGEVLEHLRITDSKGKEYPVQRSTPSGKIGGDRARFVARATLPALGWKTFFVKRHERSTVGVMRTFGDGAMGSVDFHAHRREAFRAGWDELSHPYRPAEVYRDNSDTWGHGIVGYTELAGTFEIKSVEKIEQSVLYTLKRAISTYNTSTLIEEYKVDYRGDVIDLNVTLDWHEPNAVVKLRFDHLCDDAQATYEIPYAAMERPLSTDEQPGQTWVHVRGTRGGREFGMAVINDAKYSYSVTDTSIYLTVARSPLYAHHVPPHTIKPGERLEYLDQGRQSFNVRLIFNCVDWNEAHLHESSAQLHQPVIPHYESAHNGSLPTEYSAVNCSRSAIDVTVIKRAENGENAIVRAVNRSDKSEKVVVAFGGHEAELAFGPFEIKTLLVRTDTIEEISAIEI